LQWTENKGYSRTTETSRICESGGAAADGTVLASAGFARNERLSRSLRFVVERHMDGRDEELKDP
jgi:hypothetical protein